MEKKGDILNQLALIADLMERANLESNEMKITYTVNRNEFERIFKIISQKTKEKNKVTDTFSVKMGDVDIIFNTNNV